MKHVFRKYRRGSNILEYVVVFCVVIAVFVAMANYVQRGMMGQVHKAGATFGYGRQ